jgi:hypothetical protein
MYRGTLKDVLLSQDGVAYATLASVDAYSGEKGRNSLTEGGPVATSVVMGFEVVEGKLVMETTYSKCLIEGKVLTSTGHFYKTTKSVEGIESLRNSTDKQTGG